MKLKALLLACAVAGAGASFALADGGHGTKHNESSSTATSTPGTTTTTTTSDSVRFELKGTIATVSATSLTLNVTKANEAGKALVGHTATVAVDPKTRVEWSGTGTLTGPNTGDSVKVKAYQSAGSATLTAKSVSARGPESKKHD